MQFSENGRKTQKITKQILRNYEGDWMEIYLSFIRSKNGIKNEITKNRENQGNNSVW